MSVPWPADAVVYVVDDDAGVRDALGSLLRSCGLTVVAFDSAEAFLAPAAAHALACVVLDVRMAGMSGLELQRKLSNQRPGLPIVFLTGHGDIPMAVQAIKGGAVQFLTKPVQDDTLLNALRQALRAATSQSLHIDAAVSELHRRATTLTQREREVAGLVTEGLRNKQIAQRLGIGEGTVKVHRQHVMRKMEVASVAELVRCLERLRALDRSS
jgi:FixJ family two-component response regulator